jgi:hypothetical protein
MKIDCKIGPSFPLELDAAGLRDGIAYSENAVFVADDMPPDALDKLQSVIAAHDPTKPAPPAPIAIDKIEIWRRMTDAEHDAMIEGVATQSQRIQDIFNAVVTFRSNAPEWPLLQQMATQLYGSDRAAELLAPNP